ncbi:hypothetical protein C0Q70_12485 [Pomacea canaliculata]|uniref:Phospholipid scramblase n=2 Tax=Pomacea canaliculata TaxID=400727 RepID=A0A2T7P1M9_POMCA|nr:hypothetical protein C0Q70_12485 [Pomacea canaliculata]
MSGVVIAQPGQNKPAEMVMMQAPVNVTVPAGLPPGLAYLASLDEIRIHQQLQLLEVIVGWERNNRYFICNNQEQQFMAAKEDTDCLTRQFCGTARPFVINITDTQGMQLIQLHRPFRCQGSCLWCCCLQEMDIQSPPGISIGQVKEV